jgi:putative sterol carrier protein
VGLEVFWDQTIPAGMTFRQLIWTRLEGAKALMPVWSKNTENPFEARWMLDEVDEASRREIPILPVHLEHCSFPMGFRNIESCNLADWHDGKDHPEWTLLLGSLGSALGRNDLIDAGLAVAVDSESNVRQALRTMMHGSTDKVALVKLLREELAEFGLLAQVFVDAKQAVLGASDQRLSVEAITQRFAAAEGIVPGKILKWDFGDEGVITLDGRQGRVSNDDVPADTTLKMNISDFESMAQGKLDPTAAFMQGKFRVEGDMGVAMQLQGVLAKLRG